jgi:hypothetical protein
MVIGSEATFTRMFNGFASGAEVGVGEVGESDDVPEESEGAWADGVVEVSSLLAHDVNSTTSISTDSRAARILFIFILSISFFYWGL